MPFSWIHQDSVSQPVDHSDIFEWATKLGQKFVRIQLFGHLITTSWEHTDFIQRQDYD